jgi:hypothetical protein
MSNQHSKIPDSQSIPASERPFKGMGELGMKVLHGSERLLLATRLTCPSRRVEAPIFEDNRRTYAQPGRRSNRRNRTAGRTREHWHRCTSRRVLSQPERCSPLRSNRARAVAPQIYLHARQHLGSRPLRRHGVASTTLLTLVIYYPFYFIGDRSQCRLVPASLANFESAISETDLETSKLDKEKIL